MIANTIIFLIKINLIQILFNFKYWFFEIVEQREAIGDDREKLDRFYAEVQRSILEKAEKSFTQTNQQASKQHMHLKAEFQG